MAAQWSEDTNRKRSEALKGHKQSPEHIAARVAARQAKGPWFKVPDIGQRISAGKASAKIQWLRAHGSIESSMFYRGHQIVCFVEEQPPHADYLANWRYADDLTKTPGNGSPQDVDRPCAFCHRMADPRTEENIQTPDPCLGWLQGVRAACCGHGHPEQAYVVFDSGSMLRAETALFYFRRHGCTPPTARE